MVIDLILITAAIDRDIKPINNYLFTNCNQQTLTSVGGIFGGSEYPELHCYGGAIKDLGPIERLIEVIKEHKWKEPHNVKLIYRERERIEVFEL